MCNSDVTIEILEKAIEEAATKKTGGRFLGIFSRSSNTTQSVPAPVEVVQRAQ